MAKVNETTKATFTGTTSGIKQKDGVTVGKIWTDSSDLIVHATGILEDCEGYDLKQHEQAIICRYMFEQCQIVPFIRKMNEGIEPTGLLADEILLGIPHNMGSQDRIKTKAKRIGYPVGSGQLLQYIVDEWQASPEGQAKQAEIEALKTPKAKTKATATKAGVKPSKTTAKAVAKVVAEVRT